jgi:hypothetical protein
MNRLLIPRTGGQRGSGPCDRRASGGMEVGADGSELRPVFAACPICRSRILMRFAQWAQVLSWSPCRARKSRAVPLLSPSCPAPRMPSANPMSAPSSNFRVAKFPDSAELVAPGGIRREGRPNFAANFGYYFRPIKSENLFYFQRLSSRFHFLAIEAKSLIFLWRVFAESTHTEAVIMNPVTHHVWLVARHRRSNVPRMSRLCPCQTDCS